MASRIYPRRIPGGVSTATVTSVNDLGTVQTLLASNTARRGFTIYNDSTEILYVKFGSTATTTDFTVQMNPEEYFEGPFNYTGIVTGIWANNASGAARITELT